MIILALSCSRHFSIEPLWGYHVFNTMVLHHYSWSNFLCFFFILKLFSMYLFLWQFHVLLITTDFHHIMNSAKYHSFCSFCWELYWLYLIFWGFNLNFRELTKHSLFLVLWRFTLLFFGDCFDVIVSFGTPKVLFLIVYVGLPGYNPPIWKTSGMRTLFIKVQYSFLFSFPIIIF